MARPRKISKDILQAALIGFQHMRDQLEERITDLRKQIGVRIATGHAPAAEAEEKPAPGKRKMSAAARRRMSLAQKKRWAGQKTAEAKPAKRASSAARKK